MRQRGFTLIEAVVTLSVLALLLAVAIPNVTDWMRSTQMRTMAETMQNGLMKARMEALRRNRSVSFWLVSPGSSTTLDNNCALSSTSGFWVISVEDPTSKCGTDPSPTVSPMIVETYNASGSAVISVAGLASDGATAASSVSFNGFGQVVTSTSRLAQINITGSRNMRIEISSTGSVRMCDRGVAASDARACSLP